MRNLAGLALFLAIAIAGSYLLPVPNDILSANAQDSLLSVTQDALTSTPVVGEVGTAGHLTRGEGPPLCQTSSER